MILSRAALQVWWRTVDEWTALRPLRCCHRCAGLCQWRSHWTCWRGQRTPRRREQLAVGCAADSEQFATLLECFRKPPAAVIWCSQHVTSWYCLAPPYRPRCMPACLTAGRCGDIDVPDGVEAAWPAELCRTWHARCAGHCCGDIRSSMARECQESLSPRCRTGLHTRQGQTEANRTSQIAVYPVGRLPCQYAEVTDRVRLSWLVAAIRKWHTARWR